MLEFELAWAGKTRLFKLDDGTHKVGRAHDNAVQIADARVSKYHAMVRVAGNRFFVSDLGSTNGTEVDGRPVAAEEIEVPSNGTIKFAGVSFRRSGNTATTTLDFSLNDDWSSQVSYNVAKGYSDAARARIIDLSSDLFELLASNARAGELEETACQFVAECCKADRVVLLQDEGEATQLHISGRWTRTGDKEAPLRLSSTLVGEVRERRNSVLVANPLDDPKFVGHQSIVDLNLRSAMAAPLFDNLRVRGILYVDTANPLVRYTEDDLQVLTATANAVAVKLRNLSLERELRTAARIQQTMLPKVLEPPAGYEIDAHQLMCHSVGGDLYAVLPRPNGNLFFSVGDVAGKGMPAALAMAAATTLIRLLAEVGGSVDDIARHLHRQLYQSLPAEQFVTLFLGELDPATGHLTYVNAGHEPPLLLRANGTLENLNTSGFPIALLENFEFGVDNCVLERGDLLLLMSDGIPEATTDGEVFLGEEAVREVVLAHAKESLPDIRGKILGSVEAFLHGEATSDDVTLLLVRRAA
jgi:phosphoserine phosphatase RsbU/P